MRHFQLMYVTGPPGAGKTTLVRALKSGWAQTVSDAIFAHTYIHSPQEVVELGQDRLPFSGTDTLSMSVLPKVLTQLEMNPWPLIIAEGDRLATKKFFDGARRAGYDVTNVYLDPPREVLLEWRESRDSDQNESWVRGRETKHRKLADETNAVRVTVPDLDARLRVLSSLENPVAQALMKGKTLG